jgi:uncharacterized protein YlxP (DUF503 family)
MYVGVCRLELAIPSSSSLKDKRQVLRSITTRIRNRFNVAVAEIEEQDAWRTAVLGLACVSNNGAHAETMLRSAIDFVAESRLDLEIVDEAIDVTPVF